MSIVKGGEEIGRIEVFGKESGAGEGFGKWEVVCGVVGGVGIVELQRRV